MHAAKTCLCIFIVAIFVVAMYRSMGQDILGLLILALGGEAERGLNSGPIPRSPWQLGNLNMMPHANQIDQSDCKASRGYLNVSNIQINV